MAKKTKVGAAQPAHASAADVEFADAVRASAHQIWLAGLGAFRKAQEEGGKAFDKLVKEGDVLQQRTLRIAETKASDVAGRLSKLQDSVAKQAAGTWDKLEAVFENRVAHALASLGVPSEHDVAQLRARIDTLTAQLEKRAPAKAAKPAARKAARPAGKTAAAKSAGTRTVKPAAKTAARKAAAAKP